MKARILILTALVVFALGCEKDPFLSGGPDFDKGKRGKVNSDLVLPFKASFSTIPDAPQPIGEGLEVSLGGLISGNGTHVGRINASESRYFVTGLDLSGDLFTQTIAGSIAAANGDAYTYTGVASISLTNGSLTGTMDFTGGTGRFEGVSGSIVIRGIANPVTSEASFTGEGTIIFPK